NYLLIEKLRDGTPQQQKLAISVLAVIDRYNTIIDRAKKKPANLSEKIASYLEKKNGSLLTKNLGKISLPKHPTIQMDFLPKGQKTQVSLKHNSTRTLPPLLAACSQKISHLTQLITSIHLIRSRQPEVLTKQAVELFNMKVIALVEKNGLLSNVEARH